jgi:acyl-CoA synthetase (AMP-forming)/AMP-acid ligase II
MRYPGLGSWIERRAARSPNEVAVIAGDVRRSYREFAAEVRAIAAHLARIGISQGDRVAFHGGNDPSAPSTLFAVASIGAVWVPIHPARPECEVVQVLEDAEAALLIRAAPASDPPADVPTIHLDELASLPRSANTPSALDVDPGALVILAYTSGTTGAPKGVMLSEANILWDVIQMVAACAFGPRDVSLAATPFTRMGGLGVTVLPTLFAGGAIAIPGTVDGPGVIETIERERVTVVFANPDLLESVVRSPSWPEADLTSVRTGVVGGGLVPTPLLRAYLDRGVNLLHGYGLTEAAPVVSLLEEPEASTRADTVGRPLPFVEVRATRPDGTSCAPGEIGEWWIRGPNVTAGYWRRPNVRDVDGWFPTGDVGTIDEDGYLTFLDRASSAMRIGDVSVYPATIERALYGAPGIADAAAVDIDGRIVVAVVRSHDGPPIADELRGTLDAVLGPLAATCEIESVASIPRNAAGKVLRAELRQRLQRDGDPTRG